MSQQTKKRAKILNFFIKLWLTIKLHITTTATS